MVLTARGAGAARTPTEATSESAAEIFMAARRELKDNRGLKGYHDQVERLFEREGHET